MWLGITIPVGCVFLYAALSGNVEWEGDGPPPTWVIVPFISIFWLVGFGMAYIALKMKFESLMLCLEPNRMSLQRTFFDKKKLSHIRIEEHSRAMLETSYSENDIPVYRIEIEGAARTEKFGTALQREEKRWIVDTINRFLGHSDAGDFSSNRETCGECGSQLLISEDKRVCPDCGAVFFDDEEIESDSFSQSRSTPAPEDVAPEDIPISTGLRIDDDSGDQIVVSFLLNPGVHDDATHWLQTGYPLLNARQQGQQHPSQGSVVSFWRDDGTQQIPPYVCIPEDYRRHMGFYESAAFLSSRHNALNSGGDPSVGNYRAPDFSLPKDVGTSRMANRRDLFAGLDQLHRKVASERQFADLDDVQQQAFELVCGTQARQAFDLSQESDSLRDRYGRQAYGQSARLVEAGVSFVTINLYEKDVDWWGDHYTIEKNLRKRLPVYDQALAALVEDLADRGMSDNVLVAAFGEFGRGPRIEANAGRGHWPKAMHAVLSGGGLRSGQIVGSTTSNGGEPHDRPLKPEDLLATIYHSLGIDHQMTVPDRQNRPIPILNGGEPIRELVG